MSACVLCALLSIVGGCAAPRMVFPSELQQTAALHEVEAPYRIGHTMTCDGARCSAKYSAPSGLSFGPVRVSQLSISSQSTRTEPPGGHPDLVRSEKHTISFRFDGAAGAGKTRCVVTEVSRYEDGRSVRIEARSGSGVTVKHEQYMRLDSFENSLRCSIARGDDEPFRLTLDRSDAAPLFAGSVDGVDLEIEAGTAAPSGARTAGAQDRHKPRGFVLRDQNSVVAAVGVSGWSTVRLALPEDATEPDRDLVAVSAAALMIARWVM